MLLAVIIPGVASTGAAGFTDRITFEQISRPVPTPIPPKPKPTLSAEESARFARQSTKQFESLYLSATIYDHQITELRWKAEGREFRAISNIDFNDLCGPSEIETDDRVYSLYIQMGNEPREIFKETTGLRFLRVIDELNRGRGGTAGYFLLEPYDGEVDSKATAGIDAIHTFYEFNKDRLHADALARDADAAEREKQLKEHPPVPQRTTVKFWPITGPNPLTK